MAGAYAGVRRRRCRRRADGVTTYHLPGRAVPAPRPAVVGAARTAPAPAASYFLPGQAVRRSVNPVRLTALGRRYPAAPAGVLELLAMYPEEGADPATLELLAQLTPGQSVAQLLTRRHPSSRPGPPAELAVPVVWRHPRRRPDPAPEPQPDDLPF